MNFVISDLYSLPDTTLVEFFISENYELNHRGTEFDVYMLIFALFEGARFPFLSLR